MPLVLQRFPTARLLIVGGVDIQEPIRLVQHLGLDNCVTFTGAMPHDQISALFALSTVEASTFNTTDYPGPGIAHMEAMAAGLPVISTEVDPQSNFNLRNWENAVLIPPNRPKVMAEALIRLLSDEHLRQRIGENARQTMAQRCSWDAVSQAHITLYHKTIEQYRQRKAGSA
jgi:glycosyltransferase involved in cell wall biosynthesis